MSLGNLELRLESELLLRGGRIVARPAQAAMQSVIKLALRDLKGAEFPTGASQPDRYIHGRRVIAKALQKALVNHRRLGESLRVFKHPAHLEQRIALRHIGDREGQDLVVGGFRIVPGFPLAGIARHAEETFDFQRSLRAPDGLRRFQLLRVRGCCFPRAYHGNECQPATGAQDMSRKCHSFSCRKVALLGGCGGAGGEVTGTRVGNPIREPFTPAGVSK